MAMLQRGAGPDQPIMRTVAGEVARGRWVHIFPEGKVGYTGSMGPLRWGVGKLVCDAKARGARCALGWGLGVSGDGEAQAGWCGRPAAGEAACEAQLQPGAELEAGFCKLQ